MNKRGYNRHEAAAYCGIKKSHFENLVRAGDAPKPIYLGRRAIWLGEELDSWLTDKRITRDIDRQPNPKPINRMRVTATCPYPEEDRE